MGLPWSLSPNRLALARDPALLICHRGASIGASDSGEGLHKVSPDNPGGTTRVETLTSFDRLPLNVRLTVPKCAEDQASGKARPQKRWPVQEEGG